MCMGGNDYTPPQPAAPPPPPPVLDQSAPEVAAKTAGEDANAKALGTKQYRTSLAIKTPTSNNMPGNNTGLGISM